MEEDERPTCVECPSCGNTARDPACVPCRGTGVVTLEERRVWMAAHGPPIIVACPKCVATPGSTTQHVVGGRYRSVQCTLCYGGAKVRSNIAGAFERERERGR